MRLVRKAPLLGMLAVLVAIAQGCSSADRSTSEADLRALREQLVAAEETIEELEAEVMATTAELAVLRLDLQNTEVERNSLRRELEAIQTREASLLEDLSRLSERYEQAASRLDALTDAIAPYPDWMGGSEIEEGTAWRTQIILSGCGWDYFGRYNDAEWFLTSAEFEPPDTYPPGWNLEITPFHDEPRLTLEGVIVLTHGGVIEATTLWGEPVATYAPSTQAPPSCHSD